MPDYVKIAEEAWNAAETAGGQGNDELEAAMRQRSIAASLLVMIGLSIQIPPPPPPSTSRGAW